MDQSEDELEEDENEWKTCYVDSFPQSPAPAAGTGCKQLTENNRMFSDFHRQIQLCHFCHLCISAYIF